MKYYTINEEAAARAKEMYSWKPIVKHEDEEMNEPDAWQMAYM